MKYFRNRADATKAAREARSALAATLAKRVPALVAAFDGALKYTPMLTDHPDWSDEQCVAFAKLWHGTAMERLRRGDPNWNDHIPYCRNVPTAAMLGEARQ